MNKNMLDLYVDYLICSTAPTTATGLSRVTSYAISHDKVTRFLSKEDFQPAGVWEFAKQLIKPLGNQQDVDGVLILDDSIEEKPYTDENEIIAWHYDHCKGRTIKGINFISALYHTGKASIPVSYALVKKTEIVENKKTKKKSRKSLISKHEHFRNLIGVAIKNNVNFTTVLADSWYASAENMCYIKNAIKKDFIMPLKENRRVFLSEENLAANDFVNIKELELGKSVLVRLEGVDFPLRLTCQVFKDGDASTGTLYLVSSNIELTDEQILTTYQRRWKVEEYHKSLKNNASLASSPTKTVRTQSNHLFASICAFIRLESISMMKKINHFKLKEIIYLEAVKTAFRELYRLKCAILQTAKSSSAPA